MDASKSHDSGAIVPAEPATALPRREFLSTVVKAAGGLLLGDLAAASVASAQTAGPAVASQKFTDWGWPQPYEQISTKSKQWLQSKGWWPLNAAWIVARQSPMTGILTARRPPSTPGSNVFDETTAW